MAQAKLTERQQQIKDRLDKNQTPEQIGKALKITTNAVYQQVRRMRQSGVNVALSANGSPTGNRRTTRRASGGSTRKASAAKASTARRQSGRTRPAAAPKPQTAEELLTAEVALIEAGLAERSTRIAEAEAVIALTREEIATLEVERERKLDVIAVLNGDKVAHAKPVPKAPKAATPKAAGKPASRSNGTGGTTTPGEAADAPQAAPQAAQESDEAKLTQAEREATGEFEPERAEADAAQAAAEEPVATA